MIQRAKSKKNILKVDQGVLVIVVVLCGARWKTQSPKRLCLYWKGHLVICYGVLVVEHRISSIMMMLLQSNRGSINMYREKKLVSLEQSLKITVSKKYWMLYIKIFVISWWLKQVYNEHLILPLLGPTKAVNCQWGEWGAWHSIGDEKGNKCLCSGKNHWPLCERYWDE